MKKIYLLFFLTLMYRATFTAKTLSSSFDPNRTFVERISPVYNLIEIQNPIGVEVCADLLMYISLGNQVANPSNDNDANDGFSRDLDKGSIPARDYTICIDFYDDDLNSMHATIESPLYYD